MNSISVLTVMLCCTLLVSTAATAASSTVQDNVQIATTTTQKLEQQQIKQKAQEWGLTEEEWQRYQTLKQGRRGVFSPDLDPLTALGIEARTPEERRRFAEKVVEQDFKRVEAELAFQREVDAAWKRLYPDILPIAQSDNSTMVSTGRLALFVKADCPPCDSKVQMLLASQKPFDIYLVGSEGKDPLVREWARQHHIPAERVKNGTITLNHDAGRWLMAGKGQMPVVLEQGENGWQPSVF